MSVPAVARSPSAEKITWHDQREQFVAVVARLVGVEHDRNAARQRRSADLAHELRKSVVGDHRIGARDQRGRIGRARDVEPLVAIVDDRALAARRRCRSPTSTTARPRRADKPSSRCSRCAASVRNVSPTLSTPAGPPSGPAKLARAPRCAIATAAFAALPPFTVRNSLACVFTSGRGNARRGTPDRAPRCRCTARACVASARRHRRPPRPRRG